jgi:hypothetical protein
MKRAIVVAAIILMHAASAISADAVPEPTQSTNAPYRMFRSQNIYTLLKLDTRTGQIWQVQWGDIDHRFIVPVSLEVLAQGSKAGRFTLYPTANLYTFILLDQETGRTWQVQWGKENERFVIQID